MPSCRQATPARASTANSIARDEEEVIMTDDSVGQAANARTTYDARPWLRRYSSFVPPELTTDFSNGLEMFLATVKAMPGQAAMYYFDETMTYGELDRKSTALAAALKEHGVVYGDRVALYL